jgi:hypothetical protein
MLNNLFLSKPVLSFLASPAASPAAVPVATPAAGRSATAGAAPDDVAATALGVAAATEPSATAGAVVTGAAPAPEVEAAVDSAAVLELSAVPPAEAGAPVIRAAFFFSVSSILSNLSFRSVPCCLTILTSCATSSLRLETSSFTAFGLKPRSAMANAFFLADSAAAAMASGLPSSRAGLSSSSSSSSSSLLSLLSPSILLFRGLERRAMVGMSSGIKNRSANALNTVRNPHAALPRRAKVNTMRISPKAPPAALGACPIICPPICPPIGYCGYGWGVPAYCIGGICAGGYAPIGGGVAPMGGCIGLVLDGIPCSGVFTRPGLARVVRRLGGARGLRPGG